MYDLYGKGVSKGLAIGELKVLKKSPPLSLRSSSGESPELEWGRVLDARKTAMKQLDNLVERARCEAGEEAAVLFETHQLMLEDDDFNDALKEAVEEGLSAEAALLQTAGQFEDMFLSMDSEYMKARAADVKDISGRLLDILSGNQNALDLSGDKKYIIAAVDLAPSETIQLDKSKVLGFVMSAGTANSHTAILARTLGIPAVMNVGDTIFDIEEGSTLYIDGDSGEILVNPDAQELTELMEKVKRKELEKAKLAQLKGLPNISLDGKMVELYANIGSPADMDAVLENDAGGIGLFRSEFLYLQSNDYPNENTQFQAYKTVAEKMCGKTVIIRTLDIGADKKADYFQLNQEENPALGFRAIRICLSRPEMFKTQLRAIYRASAYGKLAIMFPMVASSWELKKAKQLCAEVQNELKMEGFAFDEALPIGIMIETPASVIIADELAKDADFFSIGTNDLTQYTLAIDRQSNAELDPFFDSHHPAVLRMIKMVAEAAHNAGIWAGICGELAADETLTKYFLSIGIDELSVAPASVLPLRDKIRSTDCSAN